MRERHSSVLAGSLETAGRTALHRFEPSLPIRLLVKRGYFSGKVFDWGCGRGQDVKFLREEGYFAEGWDPFHYPENPPASYAKGAFQNVYCGYVLNTISDPKERSKVVSSIYDFLPRGGRLLLAVRTIKDIEFERSEAWKRFNDGWLTSKGTFLKGFRTEEIVTLLFSSFDRVLTLKTKPLILIADKS